MTIKKSTTLPRFPSHPSGKRQMTETQEFEIMKLVLDKFLWLGFIMMAWGMYQSLTVNSFGAGIWFMIAGAVLLLLFRLIIVREYEILGR